MRAHLVSPPTSSEQDGEMGAGRVKFLKAKINQSRELLIGTKNRPSVKARPAPLAAFTYRPRGRKVSWAR